MVSDEEVIATRKEKIRKLLKDNHRILLVILAVFVIIVRLYWFFKLGDQPIWWDEGDYLSIAKIWSLDSPAPEWAPHFLGIRPLLLPIIWTVFFKLGLGETTIRFFTILVPGIVGIYTIYLLGRDLYNKNVGLISAAMFSVYWVWFFYSFRLLTDIPAVTLGLLSFYFFWSWYERDKKPVGLYLSLIFGVLAFSTRFPLAFVPVTCAIYLLITRKLAIFKDKTIWKGVLVLAIFLSPYLIYLISNQFAPLQFYFGEKAVTIKQPIQWNLIPLTVQLVHSFWAVSFIIGLITLIPLFLSLDILWKQKNGEASSINSHLFIVLWIIIHWIFYAAILRGGNDRWLLMIAPAVFIVASNGIMLVHDYVKKYSKHLAIILLFILLFGGLYQNYNHSVELTNSKIGSYGAIKDAGSWFKDNTPINTKIMVVSTVQMYYYSERQTFGFLDRSEDLPQGCMDLFGNTVVNDTCQGAFERLFNEKVKAISPDYYVISRFEPVFTPQWAYSYGDRYNLTPVASFPTGQQPHLVIYKFPEDFSS